MAKIHLVRVTNDDGERQLWLAATPRAEAVDRVLEAIPEGWAASLVERQLGDETMADLDLTDGQVRRHQVS